MVEMVEKYLGDDKFREEFSEKAYLDFKNDSQVLPL